MNHEIPDENKPTGELLAQSLRLHPDEKAPAIPEGLVQDVAKRFEQPAAVGTPGMAKAPRFAKIFRVLSTPAFGGVAAAVLLLAVAGPAILGEGDRPDQQQLRGVLDQNDANAPALVQLVSAPAGTLDELQDTGYFISDFLKSAESLSAEVRSETPRLVVDFSIGELIAIDAEGEEIHRSALPESTEELALEITDVLANF